MPNLISNGKSKRIQHHIGLTQAYSRWINFPEKIAHQILWRSIVLRNVIRTRRFGVFIVKDKFRSLACLLKPLVLFLDALRSLAGAFLAWRRRINWRVTMR